MDGNFAAATGTLGLVFVQKGMCEQTIGAPVSCRGPAVVVKARAGCVLTRGIYSRTVRMPVAMSATAQTTSRLTQAFRRMPTPTFANTSHATAAVTMR